MPVLLRRFRRFEHLRHDRIIRGYGAIALLIGVAVALRLTSFGLDLDREMQIWRADLHPRIATSHFAFVEIDAKSLAAVHRWPWPREHYASAITALRRAGAQSIAFDVDFSAPSQPDQDLLLSRAIRASDVPIILPTFRQNGSQDGTKIFENIPIPSLRDYSQLAAVNIFADPDGLVRSYPYGIDTAGAPRPSIGAMLAGVAGRTGHSFPIDTSIDPATIPRLSFADLLTGSFPKNFFKGRNVLIGASAIELGDRYPIPGKGVVAGPMIQLLAAETLVQRSAPIDHGFLVPLILAVLTMIWAGKARHMPRPAVYLCGGAAILSLSFVAEAARLGTFTIIPALAGLLCGFVAEALGLAWKAARQARLFDEQTGLPNGRALQRVLDAAQPRNIIILRLANFSDIANVLGKDATGEFVSRVAERLAYAGDSPVHRVDEMRLGWLISSLDEDDHAQRIDAAAAMLRAPFDVAGRRIELHHAFGIATGEDEDSITRAAHAADHAVAQGIRWCRHTPDMEVASEWRLALAGELDKAMVAGDIWVAYQPKYDFRSGKITACEALVRWRHPERGAIPPDAFIPALEESGRIADLTLHVLERALIDQTIWADTGATLGVAVNMSALLPSDPAFVDRLKAVLARYPTAIPHLTLEVTESAAMTDPDRAIQALDGLAQLGLSLSIDDYGTGQSTLSYLKRLPAREIKIDKGFVLGLETSRSDQAMVRSSIELAHELGFKVVAEGVETEVALQMLESFGCDTAQGWHIGRPMPSSDFLRVVQQRLELSA